MRQIAKRLRSSTLYGTFHFPWDVKIKRGGSTFQRFFAEAYEPPFFCQGLVVVQAMLLGYSRLSPLRCGAGRRAAIAGLQLRQSLHIIHADPSRSDERRRKARRHNWSAAKVRQPHRQCGSSKS